MPVDVRAVMGYMQSVCWQFMQDACSPFRTRVQESVHACGSAGGGGSGSDPGLAVAAAVAGLGIDGAFRPGTDRFACCSWYSIACMSPACIACEKPWCLIQCIFFLWAR